MGRGAGEGGEIPGEAALAVRELASWAMRTGRVISAGFDGPTGRSNDNKRNCMREEIVARLVKAMRERELDAVIVSSPENYAWVTGYVVPSHPLMRWRHAMAVVTGDGTVALFSVDMEATTVRRRFPDTDVHVWSEFAYDAMPRLAELLAAMGLSRAKVGMEMDYFPAGDFEALRSLAANVAFVPLETEVARLRQIKTPSEIETLRRLSMIADKSILTAYESVRAGNSEFDIAGALTGALYTNGAEYFKLMIIATGERSCLPNVGPTARKLAAGDICRVEVFPIIDGYHAGVCRTAAVERVPHEAGDIWRRLTECKHMLLDIIRPGAICSELYRSYSARLEALGLPLIPFVGHGIGLHLHEDPYLADFCHQPLEAGMVLGVEPLIYETGYGFGMQNKDLVLVTETGCELLSAHTDTDHLILVGG
jgi:Xaa-Pro dipeptidase